MSNLRVVIITGLSGAGRRAASHTMEDLGWYVVDNLPPMMLVNLCMSAPKLGITKLAVGLDVRTRDLFGQLPGANSQLEANDIKPEVLFLEASDDVIVRRQESSRRPLPLQGDGRLLDGITKERRMLSTLRASADLVIDTSNLTVRQLAERVTHAFTGDESGDLRVAVMSFGFKHGLPIDADFVFDIRFLPNPHWVPHLRAKTGLSDEVSEYVLNQDGATQYLDKVQSLIELVCDGYVREGKRHVLVAVGCTGGKHRSVAVAENLGARFRAADMSAVTFHRDLGKE
ncbi:MAG: RNase adapter RapZ [Actinomycetales bacterium]|nr:MAG: RNase adapter RapZ [Actinomycetales bacterium]